jgi:hypothetical protein
MMRLAPVNRASPLMFRVSAKPSTSGMGASINTRPNGSPASRADRRRVRAGTAPFAPSGSIRQLRSVSSRMRRLAALSSTTSTRSLSRLGDPACCGDAANLGGTAKQAVKWNRLPRPTSLSIQMRPPLALVGELDGVAHEVHEDLAEPPGVAEDRPRYLGKNAAAEFEPLLVAACSQQPHSVLDDVAEIEGRAVERQLAGLDLRGIEDVVDEGQQRLARLLHRAEVLQLFAGERRPERQLGHADDRVHRRANLVAHVGEELALGDSRLFGPTLRDFQLLDELREPFGVFLQLALRVRHLPCVGPQRLPGPLAVGDVARDRIDEAQGLHRRGDPLEPPVRAIRAAIPVLERDDLYVVDERCPRAARGLDTGRLSRAAISNPEDNPLQHAQVREDKGLRPGGLGLAITRTLVDELVYNEKRNEVVFVKYLG